jgi:LmbE family N-acetylglucosaminyl deacetylase
MARKRKSGAAVTVVSATDGGKSPRGEPSEVWARRADEARRACALLGVEVDDVVMLGFPDGELANHEDAFAEKVRTLLADRAPDDVFTTSVDGHPDHRALNEVARLEVGAARLYEYPIWEWLQGPAEAGTGGRIGRAWRFAQGTRSRGGREVAVVSTDGFLDAKSAALDVYADELTALSGDTGSGRLTEVLRRAFLRPHEIFFRVK